MAISRVTTWSAGQVLTAAALNGEFNNILNNPIALWSPAASAINFNGQTLTWDAAGVTTVASSASQAWQFTPGAKSGTPSATGGISNWVASTYTDSATASSGTAATFAAHAFQRPTIAASNTSVTTTDAATVYIANSPAAGTNETITNAWSLLVAAGNVKFAGSLTLGTALSAANGGTGLTVASAIPHGGLKGVVTNTTTLTFNAFGNNGILISGTRYALPASLTLSNSGLTAATLYYIYIYNNSGTLTLEASTTTHTTDTTAGNIGVEIKSGDNTRTLVGAAYMDAGTPGTFVDSETKRYFRNWFNDVGVQLRNAFSTNRTTTSTTFVELNSEIRIGAVFWASEVVDVGLTGLSQGSGGGGYLGISLDASTTPIVSQQNPATAASPNTVVASNVPGEGFHFYTVLGAEVTAGTLTARGSGLPASSTPALNTFLTAVSHK